jgi:hypothetical protein
MVMRRGFFETEDREKYGVREWLYPSKPVGGGGGGVKFYVGRAGGRAFMVMFKVKLLIKARFQGKLKGKFARFCCQNDQLCRLGLT